MDVAVRAVQVGRVAADPAAFLVDVDLALAELERRLERLGDARAVRVSTATRSCTTSIRVFERECRRV
jgi:hypothetical protein